MEIGKNYPDWTSLPAVPLGDIFGRLSRRDKLSFTMVCSSWKNAVTCGLFWKKLVVRIDEDFVDSSLIHLTQDFYRYVRMLSIGWAGPVWQQRLKWPELKYRDLTKRVGKFLVILYERSVQVEVLEITNWYDIFYLRKLGYLMLRFIKNQNNLVSITLNNANLYDMNFVNILVSCLRSKSSLRQLHIHYSAGMTQKNFDSWVFTSCTEQFVNITTMTLNFWVFWHFFSKLQVRLVKLTQLDLYLDEGMRIVEKVTFPEIPQKQWELFPILLPNVFVNFILRKSLTDTHIQLTLQKVFPIVSFVWKYKLSKDCSLKACSDCLRLLAEYHRDTLQIVIIVAPDVDELLLLQKIVMLKRRCKKLKCLMFNNLRWTRRPMPVIV
ncbi:uncharacterized protein LOC143200505 [Rhynchophorus ferrugineus]|uniref:F-box domain-containing protein n=1 Tax=Rhynchophorus ferrugineus TaxID=354439 RepID=A0A834LY92_RHYFE|nr:hypothetical protein GWI33_022595 [Rhynchophorus ferrugineus]KAF7264704.1 hypothetical protein GWI33_022592 [Rhynchophorus ferrugineus]